MDEVGVNVLTSIVLFGGGCSGRGDGETAQDDGHDTNVVDTSAGYSSSTATITVSSIIGDVWFDPLPLAVFRGDELVALGDTNTPLVVGTGDVRLVVGPEVVQSDELHSYYPGEEGYTEDGYPLIIHDYMRFVSLPAHVVVDEETEEADLVMHAALGEAYYDCAWTEYELDEHDSSYRGRQKGEPRTFDGDWIALQNGRQIVPESDSNFMSLMSAGDVIVVDGYSLALETHTANIIVDYWREGTGLNDFGFSYVSFGREKVYAVECYYDWHDWYATYY